jgi:hypothetical protein
VTTGIRELSRAGTAGGRAEWERIEAADPSQARHGSEVS